MKTRYINRAVSLLLCFALTLAAMALGITMIAEAATLTDINVWIIGGQSNAEGYGQYDWDDFAYDERFQNGFPDVLYWGNHENGGQDTNGFVPMTLGHGQKKRSVGAEVGIAAAVSQMGGKHAIIKCAIGSTYLYPYTAEEVSYAKHGTWTPESYVNNYLSSDGYATNHSANVNKTLTISGTTASNGNVAVGNMYNMMVELTLKPAIAKLKELGYNPIMRGMWWMQGCAETNIAWDSVDQARISYKNVLKCFINDIRADLTTIVGKDCSKMPFVLGRLARNDAFPHGKPKILAAIQQAQDEIAADTSLANVDIVNPTDFVEFAQHDAWHFKATTQKYLGESFVNKALAALGVNISTPYGEIPAAYADAAKYPFAVFDKNGNFCAAATILGRDTVASGEVGAYNEAKKLGDGAIIFMRRDYRPDTSDTIEYYQNLSQHKGHLTLDLGGNRLIQGHDSKSLFLADAKPVGGVYHDTSFTVKNGSLKATALPTVKFSSWEGNPVNTTDAKTFNFTFENVVFLGNSSNLVLACENTETAPPRATMNLTLNGCTFDLDGLSGVKLIDATDAKNTLTVNAKISGGRILADSASAFTLFAADDTMPSAVKLSKYNEKYPVLTLLTASSAPTLEYPSEDEGTLVFGTGVKNTKRLTNAYKEGSGYNADTIADIAYTDYSLSSKILGGNFTVTAEASLEDSLKMTVYIPKISAVTAISVGNKTLSLSALATKTVGGVTCYVTEYVAPAKSAANALTVKVTATAGGATINPTYTLSLADSVRERLAASPAATEAKLLKNALSFSRAAMNYFDAQNGVTISEIDSILGTGYDAQNTPAFTATAAKPSRAMGFAGVTLILDDSPRVRFYAYGIDPAKATFKQGSVKLTTKVGEDNIGKYVDVYVSYENLASNITYSVTGANKQGAFNLKAYYEYVKTSMATNTELISLVERLGAYVESVKAN